MTSETQRPDWWQDEAGRPLYLNRGCTIRRGIVMLKGEPGIYYDRDGRSVSEREAAAVGFDVAANKRARRRQELLSEATAAIEGVQH